MWSGVRKAKLLEYNVLSTTTANIASMVYNYIRDKNKTTSLEVADFLPFDIPELVDGVSTKTARIIVQARDNGDIPPHVLRAIIDCGLYPTILERAK